MIHISASQIVSSLHSKQPAFESKPMDYTTIFPSTMQSSTDPHYTSLKVLAITVTSSSIIFVIVLVNVIYSDDPSNSSHFFHLLSSNKFVFYPTLAILVHTSSCPHIPSLLIITLLNSISGIHSLKMIS